MSEHEQGWRAAPAAEFRSDATLSRSVVGIARARELRLERSGAGFLASDGDVTIEHGGCGPVLANGGVTIRNGGCGPLVANGDVSIENGGTQSIVAAGEATIGRNGFVGVVISPKVTVQEGGRVLVSSPLPLALGAGAAGIALGLLTRWVRR